MKVRRDFKQSVCMCVCGGGGMTTDMPVSTEGSGMPTIITKSRLSGLRFRGRRKVCVCVCGCVWVGGMTTDMPVSTEG